MGDTNESIAGTEISELTSDSRSRKTAKTNTTTGTGSIRKKTNKWGNTRKNNGHPPSFNISSFKGAHAKLKGKVFVKGTLQAAKYDEAYKEIRNYVRTNYGHRVYNVFDYKDKTKGINILVKPKSPMTTKIIQFTTVGENSILEGREVNVVDKDCEEFTEYQINLKQYISDVENFHSDLEKCFSLLPGQCSPSMEQTLAGEKDYQTIKEQSDSIGLIKMIERVCYNYQLHEYAPLGGWESLDRLGTTRQP